MTRSAMSNAIKRIHELSKKDGRYKPDAYFFVRDALVYAQIELGMGRPRPFGWVADEEAELEEEEDDELRAERSSQEPSEEAHLTGQELCEAIRLFAAEQFGRMARVVLNNWGVRRTRDFGEIVYNLIDIGEMTKSDSDRLEDFDDVYQFDEAFEQRYRITMLDES